MITPRFLIVGFDGLRPDCIETDMPNLHKFIQQSHHWENYCALFPTETYVNHPVIFSGDLPCNHGIIANCYYDQSLYQGNRIFTGWSIASILEHEQQPGGAICVPSLGDRLAKFGKTLRVLCANSPGSTRLQHIHADRYVGHLNCCVHNIDATVPLCEREELQTRWGNGVKLEFPDTKGNDLLCEIFFNYEVPRGLGDVTVLWFGEPDHSSHTFGIRHLKTRLARQSADQSFEKILSWWEKEGRSQGIQLITISDHGHSEVAEHFRLVPTLNQAGFSVLTGEDIRNGADPQQADIIAVGSYTIGLWLKPHIQNKRLAIRDLLMNTPEVGMIFSQPKSPENLAIEGQIPGTFSESLLSSHHKRGPDLRVILANSPKTGLAICGSDIDVGCGNHGGLLPSEIRSLLAINGSLFSPARVHQLPADHGDFAITLMSLLGLFQEDSTFPVPRLSRILSEALNPSDNETTFAKEHLRLSFGDYCQYLIRAHYQNKTYVFEGARCDSTQKTLHTKESSHV